MLLANKSFRLLILKLKVISNIKRRKRVKEAEVCCQLQTYIIWYKAEDLCFSCDVQHKKYRVCAFHSALVLTSNEFFNANFSSKTERKKTYLIKHKA